MVSKKILAAAAVASLVLMPVTAASARGYIGFTTLGVKHWIPDFSQHTKVWFQKWLERERRHGHEFNFDSRG